MGEVDTRRKESCGDVDAKDFCVAWLLYLGGELRDVAMVSASTSFPLCSCFLNDKIKT